MTAPNPSSWAASRAGSRSVGAPGAYPGIPVPNHRTAQPPPRALPVRASTARRGARGSPSCALPAPSTSRHRHRARPRWLPHFARAGRGEHQEPKHELRRFPRPCATPYHRDTLGRFLARERGDMPPLHSVARHRRVDHDACRIVRAVTLGLAPPPTSRSRDALLDTARRFALVDPDGLEDGHDVARRGLVGHRERAEARVFCGQPRRLHEPKPRTTQRDQQCY